MINLDQRFVVPDASTADLVTVVYSVFENTITMLIILTDVFSCALK